MAPTELQANRPARWKISLILTVGILSVSTAAVFIRLALQAADAPGAGFSLLLAAYRLTLAALFLVPAWRGFQPQRFQRSALAYSSIAGIMLALHFASWIMSLSLTSIAASTTLVTTNPVWVALLSWLWFKEKPSLQTGAGIGVTVIGGILIGVGDVGSASGGSNPMLGNFLALVGSWAVSLYFLLGREAQRRGLGISHHIVLVYSVAALVLLPLPPLFGSSYTGHPLPVYVCILLMALFPQLIGHTSLNWAVYWLPPTFVTLTILMEPLGSSILGYFVFGETIGPLVMLGAGFVLVGVAIAALGTRSEQASS